MPVLSNMAGANAGRAKVEIEREHALDEDIGLSRHGRHARSSKSTHSRGFRYSSHGERCVTQFSQNRSQVCFHRP